MPESKPLVVTLVIAFLGLLLFYLASPDLSGLEEYSYAFLVPVFTLVISVFSLYFIYSKLSEVMV